MADYGMKATTVRSLFAQLRQELVPIVERLPPNRLPTLPACTKISAEQTFSLKVIEQLGYDFQQDGKTRRGTHL